MIKDKSSLRKKVIILIVIILLAAAGLYSGPVTREYSLQSDKIENAITIAVVADLHNQHFGKKQENIIKRLQDAQPDIILLAGDMTNSPYETDAVVSIIAQAIRIAPCYYVTGNHEYWSYEADKICDIISSLGVVVLRGENKSLNINGNTIELCGVDDATADYYDPDYAEYTWAEHLSDLWSSGDEDAYRILLSHRPEQVEEYQKYAYDVIISGHSHGGLVRIPFLLNGLYAPAQGFFPKYAGGEYQISDATTLIVSRGLYNYKYMPRVFNPSEVVIITISKDN
ncbi:MAG: metallophosphoesterase [Clostridia bacterium]|nr:metallophosphoesterase [Clostridia bacterium]